jgi:hypothetical protein
MFAVKISADDRIETINFPLTDQYPILRDAVGGLIECVPIFIDGKRMDMWVNEEGLIHRLPYNSMATFLADNSARGLAMTPIVGDVIVTGKPNNEGETQPLTLNQTNFLSRALVAFEYVRTPGNDVSHPSIR